jgi:nitrite reductase/ring-hydroxylating ferredoxin subunit
MAQEFVTVAQSGEIAPGKIAAFDVSGRRVAIANAAGSFYAFDDACTHRHCSLAKSTLAGTTVTCFCHGSEFDVTTGQVLKPPAVQPVQSYRVRLEKGAVQVEIG